MAPERPSLSPLTLVPAGLPAPFLCPSYLVKVLGQGSTGCSNSPSWVREVADFPIFLFQLFLGILNFALQSEGSKEWLPWQPFPCFCHQGTQHSV